MKKYQIFILFALAYFVLVSIPFSYSKSQNYLHDLFNYSYNFYFNFECNSDPKNLSKYLGKRKEVIGRSCGYDYDYFPDYADRYYYLTKESESLEESMGFITRRGRVIKAFSTHKKIGTDLDNLKRYSESKFRKMVEEMRTIEWSYEKEVSSGSVNGMTFNKRLEWNNDLATNDPDNKTPAKSSVTEFKVLFINEEKGVRSLQDTMATVVSAEIRNYDYD